MNNKTPDPNPAPSDQPGPDAKLKTVLASSKSNAAAYFDITYGPMPHWKACLMELVQLFLSGIPGALGYLLRRFFYRPFFGSCGRKILIGRHVTFRHPGKIFFGENVVLDDRCVIDAKGSSNAGITIGDAVFIGRNSIVYCKNGDIALENKCSLSANCIVFSSNQLTLGTGTMVGSFSYLLSGGEYDPSSPVPFCEQSGMKTIGPLVIGPDCWIGAHAMILDGASLGARVVVAAGAVVTKPIPAHTIVAGIPARPLAARTHA
ncbi:MAG: DapH/DapD/GlmU-related protein [Kiritimatiellia bacterium]